MSPSADDSAKPCEDSWDSDVPPPLVEINASVVDTVMELMETMPEEDRAKLRDQISQSAAAPSSRKTYKRQIYRDQIPIRASSRVFDARFTLPRDKAGNVATKLWQCRPRTEESKRAPGRPNENVWPETALRFAQRKPNTWFTRSHLGINADVRGKLQPSIGELVAHNAPLLPQTLYLSQIESDKVKQRRVYFCVLQF